MPGEHTVKTQEELGDAVITMVIAICASWPFFSARQQNVPVNPFPILN